MALRVIASGAANSGPPSTMITGCACSSASPFRLPHSAIALILDQAPSWSPGDLPRSLALESLGDHDHSALVHGVGVVALSGSGRAAGAAAARLAERPWPLPQPPDLGAAAESPAGEPAGSDRLVRAPSGRPAPALGAARPWRGAGQHRAAGARWRVA